MDGTQLTQYYSYLERRRRQAIQYNCLSYYNYYVIKEKILGGIDPRYDPDLSTEYYVLIDEFGKNLFVPELSSMGFLTFEDDTLPPSN